MEEHQIVHIRTVLLVTLSILVLILLYYKLLQYFKKDMDERVFPVLLPFEIVDDNILISLEIIKPSEVTMDLLDGKYNTIKTLVDGPQEQGKHVSELKRIDLPEGSTYLRLRSHGQEIVRKLEA